jgi:hypothetical protein
LYKKIVLFKKTKAPIVMMKSFVDRVEIVEGDITKQMVDA